MPGKQMVVIPTYNERETVTGVIKEILELGKGIEILVVDDNSPDGTGQVVGKLRQTHPEVHLLIREGPRGRGNAGRAGFLYALEKGAEVVGEMDGDGSHDPQYLPRILDGTRNYDVVLGSRFVPGGSDRERHAPRRLMSKLAHFYIRAFLGLRVTDPTSGYRAFRREALERIRVDTLRARGPFIIVETLYRCRREGLGIGEVAISFRQRRGGRSKLGMLSLVRYLFQVIWLRLSPGGKRALPGREKELGRFKTRKESSAEKGKG